MKKKLTALLLTTLVIVCCVVAIPLGAFAHTEPANGQIASFQQETPSVSSSAETYGSAPTHYTLQYNTWDGVWDDNYLNYNCYAYALNITDQWLAPGYFSHGEDAAGNGLGYVKPVSILQQYVCDDLRQLGYNCIKVSQYGYDTPFGNIKLICLRNGYYNTLFGRHDNADFHFMKYQDGNWYHKPGTSAILKYNSIPDINVSWISEGVGKNGMAALGNITYDGDIYFFAYQEECNIATRYYNTSCHRIGCGNCHVGAVFEPHNLVSVGRDRVCFDCGYRIRFNGEIVSPWNNQNTI